MAAGSRRRRSLWTAASKEQTGCVSSRRILPRPSFVGRAQCQACVVQLTPLLLQVDSPDAANGARGMRGFGTGC